jgi:hypothetical protein
VYAFAAGAVPDMQGPAQSFRSVGSKLDQQTAAAMLCSERQLVEGVSCHAAGYCVVCRSKSLPGKVVFDSCVELSCMASAAGKVHISGIQGGMAALLVSVVCSMAWLISQIVQAHCTAVVQMSHNLASAMPTGPETVRNPRSPGQG